MFVGQVDRASLEHEVKAFDMRAKLVVPGYGPSTSFALNGQQRMQGLIPAAYGPFAHRVFSGFTKVTEVTKPADVAEGNWRAANDTSDQLRFPVGADAVALA